MDWTFLDEINKNFLYVYTRGLAKKGSEIHYQGIYSVEKGEFKERDEFINAEAKKKTALYIIWFVFRYVLKCKTLKETEQFANEEILRKFKLLSLFINRYIYIGIYGINEIYLYKYNDDLGIVLEILYNRYDFFEQLKCFARRTEGTKRLTRNRCLKAIEQSKEMMRGNLKCAKILKKHETNEKV